MVEDTLAALQNPSALLGNLREPLAAIYQELLAQAKAEKAASAQTHVRSRLGCRKPGGPGAPQWAGLLGVLSHAPEKLWEIVACGLFSRKRRGTGENDEDREEKAGGDSGFGVGWDGDVELHETDTRCLRRSWSPGSPDC